MVIDAVFDSLCRCFGTAGTGPTKKDRSAEGNRSHHGSGGEVSTVSSDVKRRTQRLHLEDKEFDNLFQQQQQHAQKPAPRLQAADLEQAHALARAKLAAGRRPKRKSPATRRDEIFRTRNFDTPRGQQAAAAAARASQNTFSRFLSNHQGVANALCFATPIREVDEEAAEDCSDTNTLNTCEDTITSTLYFDNKYSHIQEKRPPMPLFQSFRVEEDLRRIVATDSHNSMKMISLMKEVHAGADLKLESSSEDDDEDNVKTPKSSPHRKTDQQMMIKMSANKNDPPPPVLQNSSCSTSSSNKSKDAPKPRQQSSSQQPRLAL
jgi:hypothetical protein